MPGYAPGVLARHRSLARTIYRGGSSELPFNGPFQLEPLGEWDYAGYVGPWLHGRLSGVLEPPSGPRIGLRVDFLSSHGLSDSEFEQLSKPGRDSLQSDEPLLRKLNPSVVEMTMTFVREL